MLTLRHEGQPWSQVYGTDHRRSYCHHYDLVEDFQCDSWKLRRLAQSYTPVSIGLFISAHIVTSQ